MTWNSFIYFAIAAILLWSAGAWAAWKKKASVAFTATLLGLLVFFSYILAMWITLQRPPLRTMGETRLWYSLFLPLTGLIIYARWRYKWILSFATILSAVFICINILKPEIQTKTLMPALQSPWFAPHVIVYMFAYALLGAATVMAFYPSAERTLHIRLRSRSRRSSHTDARYRPRALLACLGKYARHGNLPRGNFADDD